MTKEEINKIKVDLFLYHSCDWKEIIELLNYIDQLQQENEKQKEILDYFKENIDIEEYEGDFDTPSEMYLTISLSEVDGDIFNKTKARLEKPKEVEENES